MRRAIQHLQAADMTARQPIDTITLDRASRWRRRILLKTDSGHDLLLDLAETTYLAHGDGLVLEEGAYIQVMAAKEPLYEVHVHSAIELARIAWHIGNRHTACELTPTALYIQRDRVLADMIMGLGGHIHEVMRPFEPERGAYGHKGALAESHHHGHDHGHDHSHAPGHPYGHDH
jgi:urease accessory protein